MSTVLRVVPLVLKQIRRSPIRSILTISGIAIAMFLFCVVEAMREGVTDATVATAEDATAFREQVLPTVLEGSMSDG